MTAYIAYDNKIPLGTVTASETPGFEKENAFDWFTYTWWLNPIGGTYYYTIIFDNPVTIDYFAIAAHNLISEPGNDGFFQLQGFIDGDWVAIANSQRPLFRGQNIFALLNEPVTITDYRLLINTRLEPAAYIGVFAMGEVLELPEGIKPAFTPPQWGHDDKITSVLSQTGQFLGRSVERYGLKHNITQTQVDPEWMRENWLSLAAGIRANPFFYSWNQEEYPEDVVYSWLDDKLPNPIYTSPIYTDFTLKCKALYDSE